MKHIGGSNVSGTGERWWKIFNRIRDRIDGKHGLFDLRFAERYGGRNLQGGWRWVRFTRPL